MRRDDLLGVGEVPGRAGARDLPPRATTSELRSTAHFIVNEATVKTHLANLLAKLKLRDQAHAAILAYDIRFVTPACARNIQDDL